MSREESRSVAVSWTNRRGRRKPRYRKYNRRKEAPTPGRFDREIDAFVFKRLALFMSITARSPQTKEQAFQAPAAANMAHHQTVSQVTIRRGNLLPPGDKVRAAFRPVGALRLRRPARAGGHSERQPRDHPVWTRLKAEYVGPNSRVTATPPATCNSRALLTARPGRRTKDADPHQEEKPAGGLGRSRAARSMRRWWYRASPPAAFCISRPRCRMARPST